MTLPSTASLATKRLPQSTPLFTRIVNVPVCSERMDVTIGLLTILCQHAFRCSCLSNWKDNNCPVCRYSQSGVVSCSRGSMQPKVKIFAVFVVRIQIPGFGEWMPVLLKDFLYLMSLYMRDTMVVASMMMHMYPTLCRDSWYLRHGWYATHLGLCWIHCLIQNQSDGKPVELPSSRSPTNHSDPASGGYVPREKQDKIRMEYIYLLMIQPDSQSTYSEEKVAQVADTTASMLKDTERWHFNVAILKEDLQRPRVQHDTLTNEIVPQLVKERIVLRGGQRNLLGCPKDRNNNGRKKRLGIVVYWRKSNFWLNRVRVGWKRARTDSRRDSCSK